MFEDSIDRRVGHLADAAQRLIGIMCHTCRVAKQENYKNK